MWPWRTIFFAINTAVSLTLVFIVGLWVVEISAGSISVITACAGTVMASPVIGVLIAEWLLFSRRSRKLEVVLGIVAGFVGFLACFAFVANAGEAIVRGGSPGIGFWLGFGLICAGIAAYCFWCCWLRVRHKSIIEPRGFPIDLSR